MTFSTLITRFPNITDPFIWLTPAVGVFFLYNYYTTLLIYSSYLSSSLYTHYLLSLLTFYTHLLEDDKRQHTDDF
jgi:hypothetical protein